jgi:hypothetical protein
MENIISRINRLEINKKFEKKSLEMFFKELGDIL